MCSFSECVANGGADAGGIGTGIVRVVIDQVNTRFGTDEEAALGIKLDAPAEVCVKVLAAGDETAVAGNSASIAIVQTSAHGADATDEFQIGVAGNLRRVHDVEVVKQRSVVDTFFSVRDAPVGLGRSPVHFCPSAEIVPEGHVTTKTDKSAAAERCFHLTVAATRASAGG